MTQALLVPIDRLKPRVGLPIREDEWDEVLTEAIRIGTSEAEDFLRSSLELKPDNLDVFDIATSNYLGRVGDDGYYTLVTKQRFIKNPVVRLVTREPGVKEEVTDTCLIDLEKGVIKLPVKGVVRYVEVAYSSGLTPETIPSWTSELILVLAGETFALPDDKKQRGVKGSAANLESTYATHHRQIPFAIRPML